MIMGNDQEERKVTDKKISGRRPSGRSGNRLLLNVARQIVDHQTDGFILGLSEDGLTLPVAADEAGVAQFLDVMGNRGEGDVKIAGYGTDGRQPFLLVQNGPAVTQPDLFKHAQPGFVGQGFKGGGHAGHVRRRLTLGILLGGFGHRYTSK